MNDRIVSVLSLLLFFFVVSGCSTTGGGWKEGHFDRDRYLREHSLKRFQADVPIVINDNVIAWMEYFQGPGRSHFERYLERSGRYLPMMQRILKEEGVPQDLVYISLIESGFNPHARSRARAVGAWQFMSGTGRLYGLQSNAWFDERRDPEAATRAAARHFRDLYQELSDWYLCMAAYNAGLGKVRRAMAHSGSRDFWVLSQSHRKLFRPETRDYVPKYLAAMLIAKNPEKFGFHGVNYQQPLAYDKITIPTQTDFNVIAKSANVSLEDIRNLNPHLLRDVTPYGQKDYVVNIPAGTKETFYAEYAKVSHEDRVTIASHRVARGENVGKIARRYQVSIQELLAANNMRTSSRIYPGQQLVIPRGGKQTLHALAQAKTVSPVTKQQAPLLAGKTHTVRRGESLWTISQKYQVSLSDLLAVNEITRGDRIHAGKKLNIPSRGTIVLTSTETVATESPTLQHELKPGETLGEVAAKYGVRARDLMEWNGIQNPRRVRAGTVLEVKQGSIGL